MGTEPAELVTRPEGQAGDLCAGLAAAGLRPVERPMLVLEPLPGPDAAQRQLLLELDSFSHIIFISANAVRFGLDWIDAYWPQLPAAINWYAIGERTAALLEERGLAPLTPGQEMTTEGLLALPGLQAVRSARVLIVRGEGGRDSLRQALVARGASVDSLVCYRRRAPRLAADELLQILRDQRIRLVMLSSGEGLANFTALLPPDETTKLQELTVLVPSERVAAQARESGWSRVLVARNASDAEMLAAAKAWYSGEGRNK
jgi:uroporphyrinogen-III synthase